MSHLQAGILTISVLAIAIAQVLALIAGRFKP